MRTTCRLLVCRQVSNGFSYSKHSRSAYQTAFFSQATSATSEIADLTRVLSASGGVSIKTLNASSLVRQATELHNCSLVAAAALGRVIMGTILLAAGRDHNEVTQVRLFGGGPLGVVCAEAMTDENGLLGVRGFVENPYIDVPTKDDGSHNVGAAIGTEGVLRVQRSHPSWKQPYSSVTALVTGEVGDDLAHYMMVSEQTPSAMGVGVTLLNESVVGAAAFLCAALPGCTDAELDALEASVLKLPKPSALASLNASDVAESLADDCGLATAGAGAKALTRQRWDETVVLRCNCTGASMAESLALALGSSEAEAALRGGIETEVKCDWCGRRHLVSPSILSASEPVAP